MTVPTNLFMWVLAVLPIAVLLVLMIKCQWGATEAAPVGLLIAVVNGLVFYKADLFLIASESAKGIWSALVVLVIVWTAILLYEVANEAKAFITFRKGMQKLLPNELLQVLAMGWVFVSFLMGITGFGVPVAVGAPLLVGIGVMPLWAVIIPLIGHAWGTTFGTLAVAWDALTMTTGMKPGSKLFLQTALYAALLIWIWNLITGIATCWFYGKGKAVKKGLPAVAIISLIQGGGEVLLTQVNTTIACFVPACFALAAVFLIGRMKMYREPWSIEDSPIMNREVIKKSSDAAEGYENMNMFQAFFPYIVLTGITLFVLLISPVKNFLGQISFSFNFPKTVTGYGFVNEAIKNYSPIAIFTHASMFLLISSAIGLFFYKKHGWIPKGRTSAVFLRSIKKTVPSGIAVIGFIIMSKVMGGTGQTMVLAQGIANILGRGYVVLAPVVGLLGAFMTSSTMASNILFGGFQLATAKILNLNVAAILSAQTVGATIGNTICPSDIVLGTTTAEILGKEGEALKRILPITLISTAAAGVILFVMLVLI